MPALGLGTYLATPKEVYHAVLYALELGYRHLDCAYIYGNQQAIGEALQFAFKKGIVRREDVWITSKLWCSDMQPDDVMPALQNTLEQLQLRYLDLYLIHWPVPIQKGLSYPKHAEDFIQPDQLPYTQTWQALEKAHASGAVQHLGVSNFNVDKLQHLLSLARVKPEVNQVEMHPFLAQNPLVEYCAQHHIHITGYAPLGTGTPGVTATGAKRPSLLNNSLIGLIAKDHYATPAQVMLAWAMQRGTSVIPKSVTPARIAENFKAHSLVLRAEEMEQINELDFDYRYVSGEIWTIPGSPHTLQNLWD